MEQMLECAEKNIKGKEKKYTNGHNTQICKRNEFKIV